MFRSGEEILFLSFEDKIHILFSVLTGVFQIESVRHYIRDLRDVFPVCNSHEWHIDSRSGLDPSKTLSST